MLTRTINDCQWDDCTLPQSGKSKYCKEHKKDARAAWKARIEQDKLARAERDNLFGEAFAQAHENGHAAATQHEPTPMVVGTAIGLTDKIDPTKKTYYVGEGVCGFGWISIAPGNSPLANYAKKYHGAHKAYRGGVQIWVGDYGQSYERKMQYARAYAETLREVLANWLAEQKRPTRISAGGRLD